MRLPLGDRTIDLETGVVSDGTRLTQFECRLLKYLVALDGRPASRDALLVDVWDYPHPVPTRAVDTAIRRLRRKIEPEPSSPVHLMTVQGEGYRWVPSAPAVAADPHAAWEARRVEAEAFFGRPLALHDPEVGVHDAIAEAYAAGLAALGPDLAARFAVFTWSREGFAADEARLSASDLRALVGGGWLAHEGRRYVVAPAFWGVLTPDVRGVEAAVVAFTRRLESDDAPPSDDALLTAIVEWPASAEARARLLLATARSWTADGAFAQLVRGASAVRSRLADAELRIEVCLVEANAHRGLGAIATARERAAEASELARDAAPAWLGTTRGREALMAHTDSDWDAAEAGYAEAVSLLEADEPGRAAAFLAELGVVRWTSGRAEQGLSDAQAAHRLAQGAVVLDPDDTVAASAELRASRAVASILVGLGRTWEAMPRIEALAERARDSGLTSNLTVALLSGATAYLDAGQLDSAEAWFREARANAEAAGEVLQVALAESGFGYVAFVRGELDAASRHLERCVRTFEDAGIPRRTAVPRCWVAMTALRRADHEAARRAMEVALALPANSPGVQGTLGLAAAAIGVAGPEVPDAAEAQAYFRIARRAWTV